MRAQLAALLALGASAGCTSTETGNPPLDPGIDIRTLDVTSLSPPPPDGGMPVPGPIQITGAAGTLAASVVRLLITPLDSSDPVLEVTPAPDGSFTVVVPTSAVGELRIQVDEGSRRRPPIDVVPMGSALTVTPHPLGDCLSVPLELVLTSSDAVGAVQVANACDVAVSFDAPRSRLGALILDGTGWILAPGERRALDVRLASTASPPEDTLLVGATAPDADRRPVTVRAAGP